MAQVNIEIKDNTGDVRRAIEEAGPRIMEAIGLHLQGEAADELENDPRRVDTGDLKNSITHIVQGNDTVYIGTNISYGIYVHEGTRRMAPNRFLKNAVEKNSSQIMDFIENGLKNA